MRRETETFDSTDYLLGGRTLSSRLVSQGGSGYL